MPAATSRTPPSPLEPEIEPATFERRWLILAVLCTSLMIVIIGNTVAERGDPAAWPATSTPRPPTCSGWSTPTPSCSPGCCSPPARSGTGSAARDSPGGLAPVPRRARRSPRSATQPTTVIAARALMGSAAAFVMPSTLSILTNVFPAHERAKAIGVWAGISGGGAAARPGRVRLPARALLVGVGVPGQHPA